MDLKIKDVAELLNVSETTIRRWLAEGKIPAYRLHHQYRFSRIEIENWILSCRLQKEIGNFLPSEEEQIYPQKKAKKEEQDPKKGMQQFSLFRAIHHGRIFNDIQSTKKEDLIRETMNHVSDKLGMDPNVMADLLRDREKLMPTALNNGIAVPHTRDFLLKGSTDVVAVVFPKTPIDWGALDENPVHTIFFLFACDDKRHLHLLAKLAHLSSNDEALELMRSQPSKKELLDYVKDWESSVGEK
ncbi:MAG: PTS sugar transporter subunit IIA [Candidatus Neptunochlamydia sp.]|nr:PTS sugar transporter subunit IIA [Candidatus Neptunochlamydia sp.]